MARYTIEDTTLTALGDAVRTAINKSDGVPVLVEAEYEFSTTGTISEVNYCSEPFKIQDAKYIEVKDLKIEADTDEDIYFKVGRTSYLPYKYINLYPSTEYKYGDDLTPDTFNVPTESGYWYVMIGVRTANNTAGVKLNISFTATGLDANNEVLVNKEIMVPYLMTPNKMVEELNNINALPPEALYLTGDLTSRFAYNGWNWFIEQYGDKIVTENITTLNSTFVNSPKLKEIPFDLNCRIFGTGASILGQTFQGCSELIKFPNIYIHTNTASASVILDYAINEEQNIFLDDNISIYGFKYSTFNNSKLTKEPDWLFNQCDWDQIRTNTKSEFGTGFPVSWQNAYYIKELPSFSNFYSEGTSNYYSHWYSLKLTNCYNLQNLVLPRPGKCVYSSSPNSFGSGFQYLTSLKNLIFDVQEDGTPYAAQWKNTTLSLIYNIGYYDGGVSHMDATKQVTDDESYQRLKNDPAYWTADIKYSCYNHDSAVNTINSLPDTSSYGTNTIKFKGQSGSLTDGGAINTLTEEEIAVATAKGWTVTFS